MFIIGDIHGQYDLLSGLYKNISEYKEDVYSVGDIIDRGPDSIGCIRFIRNHDIKPVMGNHEQMFLDATESNGLFLKKKMNLWISNGGYSTLEQFSMLEEDEINDIREYMESLPYYIYLEEKDILIVHAGLKRIKAIPFKRNIELASMDEDFLWYRNEYLNSTDFEDLKTLIITGHTPLKDIWCDGKNRFVIDTGAYSTGKLTALRIYENKIEGHYFSRDDGYFFEEIGTILFSRKK